MRLSKWQALGNVYLLAEQAELTPERVRELCDGQADGVLEVKGGAKIKVWNADGSVAEMSGNGARIAAAWLARKMGAKDVQLRVGERDVTAHVDGDNVTLDVGRVDVGEMETLDVDGEQIEFTPVSVGNPHAVVRGDPGDVQRLGSSVELHPRFPNRTNVQLVRVDGAHDISVGVWERGVGRETPSSGTSSVAAAAAAIANGWCASPVRVHLAGGDLLVELDESYNARLSGPVGEILHTAEVVNPSEMRMGSAQYGQLVVDGQPLSTAHDVEFRSLVWSNDHRLLAWQQLVSWVTEPKTRVVVFDADARRQIAVSEPHLGLFYPFRFERDALVYREWKEGGHRRDEGEQRLFLPDEAASP
jgi:diaminopimelate epimerase